MNEQPEWLERYCKETETAVREFREMVERYPDSGVVLALSHLETLQSIHRRMEKARHEAERQST